MVIAMTELIAPKLTELEQLNLKVAAIAGWENIDIWCIRKAKKTFIGDNKKHPELGKFVPDYTSDLNAIAKIFGDLNRGWTLSSLGYAACGIFDVYAETPAIALCKLLLELHPEPQVQIIGDDGDIE
jgi:hypothetical protein